MFERGTSIITKKDSQKGKIVDCWNPHQINSKVFPSKAPDGYAILLENGCVRICLNADFKVCGK